MDLCGFTYHVMTYISVFHQQRLKESLEVGASKMSDGAEPCEQTAVGDLLEVPLTDVLKEDSKTHETWGKLEIFRYNIILLQAK